MRPLRIRIALALGVIAGCIICQTIPSARTPTDLPPLDAEANAAYWKKWKEKAAIAKRELAGREPMMYVEAEAAEAKGDYRQATRIYRQLALAGEGKAALRLSDIYQMGRPGVSRDHYEAVQFYEIARQYGMKVGERPKR